MEAAFVAVAVSEFDGVDAVIVNVTQVFKSDQDAAGWNNAAVPV